MDEDKRRQLHELIARATTNDPVAPAALEEMIVSLDRAGSPDDVAAALDMLATFGLDHIHQAVVTRLQQNDYRNRQQPPLIG